ncbi:Endonuclease/exonuclease/phosphatase [Coniochaeta sp. 2T2.1]|nr:Endonuclease/exonuclease/phosphatase [Coniochaeta sp. 2T2.1]
MEPRTSNGTDGSSIRPVSALLARFENMAKPTEPQAGPPPPRTRSPSPAPPTPLPDKVRDGLPIPSQGKEPPAVPKTRPAIQSNSKSDGPGLRAPNATQSALLSPHRPVFPPQNNTPNALHTPALTLDPPQSPPKGNFDIAVGEQPHFLHTDSLIKPPISPATGPKPFKIPSRPITPTLEPGRSPRISPSQPPSPPPPRRSAELRREREKPTPPPINRAEKPTIPSKPVKIGETGRTSEVKSRVEDKRSPFNSPPSSSATTPEDDEDVPPMLPTRPRPQPAAVSPPEKLARASTYQVGFEPPPLHHSIANRRREREEIGPGFRGAVVPHTNGEVRPTLPARPQNPVDQPRGRNGVMSMLPPPRPPRPAVNTGSHDDNSLGMPQKRVASTPTTMQPPPTMLRMHGRSNTVSHRKPGEFRVPSSVVEPSNSVTRPSDPLISSVSKAPNGAQVVTAAYPDTSKTNRRPPYIKSGVHEVPTKYDSRIFDVCGEKVCTGGTLTRVWSLLDGEMLMSLAMGEGTKATALSFKPGANVDEEGVRVWIGTSMGDIMEADIATQSIMPNKAVAVHGRHEIIKIYRHYNELWSLDEGGTLHVWSPDSTGVPNLANSPTQTFRVPRGHSFSMVVGDELWYVTGKDIRVFLPSTGGDTQFQVLIRPLGQESIGEITSGTLLPSDPDKVFFGHNDGKISIYSRADYSCLEVVSISTYKINSLGGVGTNIWAGYNTGRICVYDLGQTPWAVKKDWQAHDNPIVRILPDRASCYKLNRYQVVSLGADNMVRTWDGHLQEDWLEAEMKAKDVDYCDFKKLKALVMTWNAGASTPNSLRYSESDSTFIQNLLQSSGSPDIIVFGFQELVDLEDKAATAKRFLKPKKKEGSDQERMSHQYRDWRDFLVRSLDDYLSGDLYHLLHTAPLVGLFTCIFVKADLRDRISNLGSAEVKRGMGGLHGNKGAIVVRFMIDDTSMCFVNCHLAAGQSQANSRHADIAAILETAIFPVERDQSKRMDSFIGGGDGTMILDHELCLVSGDLNYRIDTMTRDTVVTAVKSNNLAKLLERDQLLVARRRNPGFKLRAFDELPITFAPTYKYDVGTDNYDTSEKKRSPAWCDRLLYRGRGRIEQLDYVRHEVRVSDHRPVSGRFWFTVKRISAKRRAMAWMECQQRWEDLREREADEEKLYYLTRVIGYEDSVAKQLIKYRSRKDHRSPSKNRD